MATRSDIPAFRAFDWSPANPALVALGQSSGEATVVRIDDGSEAPLSFPIRSQRLCNAVALSSQNLLAAGLDKVRNDFCLNVWDLNQRVPSIGTAGTRTFGGQKIHVDPYAKLASSEPITSIKFFAGQPQTLVAGVKSQFVRLYDIREPQGHTALQFATRCVHNIAIDPCDENYIASCVPNNDAVVCIWDRRAGSRIQSAALSFGSDTGQPGPSLELKNVADAQSTIWSLRFARSRRGCLGMLTSTGQFKTFDIGKEQVTKDECRERDETWGEGWADEHPEDIFIDRMQEIERAHHAVRAARREKNRLVSFDFITHDDNLRAPGVICLAADGKVEVFGTGRGERASSFSPFAPNFNPLPSQSVGGKPGVDVSLSSKLFVEKRFSKVKQERLHPGHSQNPNRTFRERCEEGYQFDPAKNRSIVSKDINLSRFWRNVDRALAMSRTQSLTDNALDFSYLGVHGIWMDEMGIPPPFTQRRVNPSTRPSPAPSKTTEALARELGLPPMTPSPLTSYNAHRRLCLFVTGLQKNPTDLEKEVNKLLRRGHPTKAAAKALFASDAKLATRALRQETSSEVHKMLAMAIASSQSRQRHARRRSSSSSVDSGSSDTEWNDTVSSLSSSLPRTSEDPYGHAIIHSIIHDDPAHPSILSNPDLPLPLPDKIFIALHHLSDHDLSIYISNITQAHVSSGDLSGILLTGLGTPGAVKLLSNYVTRTGDVQTAVLALAPAIPRYLSSPSIMRLYESWRYDYRTQMQIWDLKFERVRFDVAGRKLAVSRTGAPLLKPAKAQISLTCTYCQQSVAQIPAPAKPGFPAYNPTSVTPGVGSTDITPPAASVLAPDSNVGHNFKHATIPAAAVQTTITKTLTPNSHPLASTKVAAIGTICPKCGRGLPRCGICELPLGMPDSTYVKPHINPVANNLSDKSKDAGNNTSSSIDKPSGTKSESSTTKPYTNPTISSKRGSIAASTVTTATQQPSSTDSPIRQNLPLPITKDPNQQEKESSRSKPQCQSFDLMMSKFVTFCISCGHGFHANHAREWFGSSEDVGPKSAENHIHGEINGDTSSMTTTRRRKKGHKVCPVPDCGCVCDWRGR